jgi:hypothetical protein
MCRHCTRDLRTLWLVEVEAITTDATACDRARAAAEYELAERLAAQDIDDAADEQS